MQLKMPHNLSDDVSTRKAHTPKPASHVHDIPLRAHTPKPASHVHDIPLRERTFDMIFHIVQPASRVAFERMLEKLANYTKNVTDGTAPPVQGL